MWSICFHYFCCVLKSKYSMHCKQKYKACYKKLPWASDFFFFFQVFNCSKVEQEYPHFLSDLLLSADKNNIPILFAMYFTTAVSSVILENEMMICVWQLFRMFPFSIFLMLPNIVFFSVFQEIAPS